MRVSIVLALCLLGIGSASAEPVEEAAEAVLAAHRDGGDLTALAARTDPDPWLVADELLRRGERVAAAAFAKAARGKDVEALPKYLDGWRPGERDTEARVALARARAALEANEPAKALEVLADLEVTAGTVLSVRLENARGRALATLRRFEKGMAARGAAAEAAERIGWLRDASAACQQAAVCANARADNPAALRWSERNLRIQQRRGDRLGEALALADVGGGHQVLGQVEKAQAALDRALAILDGDLAESPDAILCRGAVLFHLARIHRFKDDLGRAMALGARALEASEKAGREDFRAWVLANLGEFELTAGELLKASDHLERALALMRKCRNGRGIAFALGRLAELLADRGELVRAGGLLREALATGEASQARWEVALALIGLGALEARGGSRTRALEHWERALAILRAIGDTGRIITLQAELARTHWALGDGSRCRELLEEALARAEEIPVVRMRVRALNRMAGLLDDTGERERGEALRIRALELAESIGDRLGIADALGGLGAIAIERWELDEATEYVTRSLEIYRALGLPFGVTEALGNLGIVHMQRGSYAEAEACHREGLRLASRTGNLPAEVSASLNLMALHRRRGRFARAVSRAEEGVRLARETRNLPLLARATHALAFVLGRIGRTDRARALLQEVLDLRERMEDRRGEADCRESLGVLLHDLGDLRGARLLLDAVRASYLEMGDLGAAAHCGGNLGIVLMKLGRTADARPLLEAALRAETVRGNGHGIIQIRLSLAFLDRQEGRLDAAREEILDLKDEAERRGDVALVFECFVGLADVESAAGRPRETMAACRLAVRSLPAIVRGFGEEEGASVRARYAAFHDVFDDGVAAAAELNSPEDLCYFIESGRAGTLLESLGGRDRIADAALPPALAEADAEARAAEQGAWMRLAAALDTGSEDVGARREELARAREHRVLLAERIRRESKEAGAVVYPEADSLAAIRGRLHAGETIVLYATLEDEILALVVERDGARIARLGAPEPIERAAERLVGVGRPGARGVVPTEPVMTPEEEAAAAALALQKLVIDPLGLGASTSRVLISADGILTYVPFALLLGDRELVHVPSGTTYGLLVTERARRGEKILALGDPVYPEAAAVGTRSATRFGMRLKALPATRVEAKAVGDVVLLGAEASETRFAAAVGMRPRWRAVHLACHGCVDPRNPMLSALALTPDEKSDGLLFCRDVFEMRIPADLVVLSACETARGKVYRAEGILGLLRAFLCAGAPRVLCSLWKVDDEATRALMVRFYELWKDKGIPAARALREAQAHVRSKKGWSDPYYWAAWTLWGLGD